MSCLCHIDLWPSEQLYNMSRYGDFLPSLPLVPEDGPDFKDDEDDDGEDRPTWIARLTHWLEQMMFVSGETAEVPAETTSMIEEIVRQQVIEMVSRCRRRRSIGPRIRD